MNNSTSAANPRQDYWKFFAEDSARTSGTSLYPKLSRGVGEDEELKALAARVRQGQPMANILFGAVHFLLLRGAKHPLARFYRSVGGTVDAAHDDPFPDFRDFVLANRAAIEPIVSARVTNTNEVGRSALLHPAFRTLAQRSGAPLHLVEIGPSAGLNLIWDSYGVRYVRDGKAFAEIDAAADTLVLDCELRGDGVPPALPAPKVGRRIGLELNPVDLSNADDRDWLRALVWPDDVARMRQLERAMAVFRGRSVDIRRGDALSLLTDVLATMPARETVCVYHTIVTYQFSRDMRDALDAMMIVASLRRPVWRLAFEYDGNDYAIRLIRYEDGAREETKLANAHPHGKWVEWVAVKSI